MKVTKFLWLQNLGSSDVSLSDLGVKVPAGKTINVYQWNPYITEEKVKKSLESGALKKRLDNKTLKVVRKEVSTRPTGVDLVKQSKESTLAKKTKSSVVLEPGGLAGEDGDEFSFADYGVNNAMIKHKQGGEVVINVTEDKIDAVPSTNKQTMETLMQFATDPIGPLVQTTAPNGAPFVVAKPKESEPVVEPEVSVKKTSSGVVVAAKPEEHEPSRSVSAVKSGTQDSGVIEDTQDTADKVIQVGPAIIVTSEDTHKENTVVMSVEEQEAPKVKKPRKKTEQSGD